MRLVPEVLSAAALLLPAAVLDGTVAAASTPCAGLPQLPSASCGSVDVPLDRADPAAGTTTVAYALVPRRDGSGALRGHAALQPGRARRGGDRQRRPRSRRRFGAAARQARPAARRSARHRPLGTATCAGRSTASTRGVFAPAARVAASSPGRAGASSAHGRGSYGSARWPTTSMPSRRARHRSPRPVGQLLRHVPDAGLRGTPSRARPLDRPERRLPDRLRPVRPGPPGAARRGLARLRAAPRHCAATRCCATSPRSRREQPRAHPRRSPSGRRPALPGPPRRERPRARCCTRAATAIRSASFRRLAASARRGSRTAAPARRTGPAARNATGDHDPTGRKALPRRTRPMPRHDYPRAFSPADLPAVRRAAYGAALGRSTPGVLPTVRPRPGRQAGFEGAERCIEWPADPAAGPADRPGTPMPDVPYS